MLTIMTDTTEHRNALPKGYKLKEYTIQAVLGDGGFGITYLAQDNQLHAQIAIKEYLPNELAVRENDYTVQPKTQHELDNYNWGLERFIEEARILAKFKHPNIVRVLRFFKAHNTAYIVMEYEQGQSLASIIKKGKTMPEAQVKRILPPLLDALETVHNAGYLHRDIKPDNIFVRNKNNSPVLIDFGAARYVVGNRSCFLTSMMTAGYAPFEQYATESNHGAWSDIYSLGAVLYRLVSAEIPVDAIQRVDAIRRHKPDPLVPAVEIDRRKYSPSCLQAIDWALKINEEDRPQTVQAWRSKLLKHNAEQKFPRIFENLKSIPRLWRKIKWYEVTILLILVALAGYKLFPFEEEPKQQYEEQYWVPPESTEEITWITTEVGQDSEDLEPQYLIKINEQDAEEIGQQIWMNESSGKISGLTTWDHRERAASLGIAHLIWYPPSKNGHSTETFPDFLNLLQEQGFTLPLWLQSLSNSPWKTSQEFYNNQQSYQMNSLRTLMKNTISQQVQFMIIRLEDGLPSIIKTLPTEKQRLQVYEQFYRLAQTPKGIYSLLDYVNFKGKGIYPNERYQEQGWGLLQVLSQMSGETIEDATTEFADAAEFVLKRRIQNAPPDMKESRWLRGWQNRLNNYR